MNIIKVIPITPPKNSDFEEMNRVVLQDEHGRYWLGDIHLMQERFYQGARPIADEIDCGLNPAQSAGEG